MKNQALGTSLLIFGLLLFNFLFWQETPGINFILFSSFLIGLAYFRERKTAFRKEVYYAGVAAFISGIMVVWHNSGWSVFMHFLTVFITIGFIKQKRITTVFEGTLAFLVNYFSSPVAWLNELKNRKKENKAFALTYSFIKLCVIPGVIFILFFIIYQNANPKFEELTHSFTQSIADIFKEFSFTRFFFLLFGFSIVSVAFVKSYVSIGAFASCEDDLVRTRRKDVKSPIQASSNLFAEFKNEYKIGLLIFGVLNLLLLIVNIIDIKWIWFDFEVPLEFNLKSFVHEGTYLLIFSILLSMVIFLYFFRGSFNFYSKNKGLRVLGKVWIIQNIILTLSVFIRNFHYINYHGLAGKRIGVIAFLLMTVFGLISLIVKMDKLKTTAYLVRLNGWFILITMTMMTCVNWDRMVVHYNLGHENAGEIDVDYYLKLNVTTAPLVLKNLDIVAAQMEAHKNRKDKAIWLRYVDIEMFKEQLEYRTSKYLKRMEDDNWASWNWADYKLKKTTKLMPLEEEPQAFN
ncbi:MAG: DUF4173 domain-containing protein [Flavobacteriales bacterium]|nr:DUF4173 domain-containing protein [Flavobacteriales bacterium]